MISSLLERVWTDRIGKVAIALAVVLPAFIPVAFAGSPAETAIPLPPQMVRMMHIQTGLDQKQISINQANLHELILLNQEVAALESRDTSTAGAGRFCFYGHNRYTDGAILSVGNIALRCEHTPTAVVSGRPTAMRWHNMGVPQ